MKRSCGSCENIAANGMTAPSGGPAETRPPSLTFSKEAKYDQDASSIKPILHFSLGEDYSRVLKGGQPLSLSTHLMVHEVLFVLCALLLCQSGFREVWEFGVASSGDSNSSGAFTASDGNALQVETVGLQMLTRLTFLCFILLQTSQ